MGHPRSSTILMLGLFRVGIEAEEAPLQASRTPRAETLVNQLMGIGLWSGDGLI